MSSDRLKKQVVAVIPARWDSTRFPGKPLAKINGYPMLGWVIQRVKAARLVDKVIVATDSEDILHFARSLNVVAVMTDPKLPSGTDRVFQAIKGEEFDVVVNVQGDEPLIEPRIIDELISCWQEEPELSMATLGHKIHKTEMAQFNVAKIVRDKNSHALYFSRLPIPCTRREWAEDLESVLKHIGIYAYSKKFLEEFCKAGVCELEECEGLEQLRALYMGERIKVKVVEYQGIGVDEPKDIGAVEIKMKALGIKWETL